nr:tetratricopeptide repeat protein [Methanosarcina horonobensis]
MNSLGSILQKQGKLREAEDIFRESLRIAEKLDDFNSQLIIFFNLGSTLEKQGRLREAETTFQESLHIAKKTR